jgi:hypothetical protein
MVKLRSGPVLIIKRDCRGGLVFVQDFRDVGDERPKLLQEMEALIGGRCRPIDLVEDRQEFLARHSGVCLGQGIQPGAQFGCIEKGCNCGSRGLLGYSQP